MREEGQWRRGRLDTGTDRVNLRTAETVGEGTRLDAEIHHLPSGDSAPGQAYKDDMSLIYILVVAALLSLLAWFILLVLLLP